MLCQKVTSIDKMQGKITPNAKKYHCCVPGCITYDTLNNFVKIPDDSFWRIRWLSPIPKKNWAADHSTVACKKHFKGSDFAISANIIMDQSGQVVKPDSLVLKQDAVPSLFPEEETNHDKIYAPRYMYELYPRDCKGPEIFQDIENPANCDFVIDYWYLKLMYKNELCSFLKGRWQDNSTEEHTIFYITDFANIPKIPVSIKIFKNLKVTVTLGDRIMDSADLVWVLPADSKLNRWSQLKAMMVVFGRNV